MSKVHLYACFVYTSCSYRCEIRQRTHRKWHEDIKQEVLQFEAKLSGCASEKVTSYDECIDQQKRVKVGQM